MRGGNPIKLLETSVKANKSLGLEIEVRLFRRLVRYFEDNFRKRNFANTQTSLRNRLMSSQTFVTMSNNIKPSANGLGNLTHCLHLYGSVVGIKPFYIPERCSELISWIWLLTMTKSITDLEHSIPHSMWET